MGPYRCDEYFRLVNNGAQALYNRYGMNPALDRRI